MAFDPNNPIASGMVQTFGDEFSTRSISSDGKANGTLWTDHIWFHAPRGDLMTVVDGVLHLKTDPNDSWGANLQTTNSQGEGFAQKFGYWEASIKLPAENGAWPSFWGINNDRIVHDTGQAASEFDIMEGQGKWHYGYYATVHRNSAGGAAGPDQQNADSGGNIVSLPDVDLTAGFHRYGMLWDPAASDVKFYFDGRLVSTSPKYDTTDKYPITTILGNLVGDIGYGGNTGQPNGADMQVDWVHVYQFANQNPGPLVGEPAQRKTQSSPAE